jgi:hypothetical protein
MQASSVISERGIDDMFDGGADGSDAADAVIDGLFITNNSAAKIPPSVRSTRFSPFCRITVYTSDIGIYLKAS